MLHRGGYRGAAGRAGAGRQVCWGRLGCEVRNGAGGKRTLMRHLLMRPGCGPVHLYPDTDTGEPTWHQPDAPDGAAHAVTGPRSCPPSTTSDVPVT